MIRFRSKSALPPGVPLGVPPELSDDEDEEDDEDEGMVTDESKSATKKISVEKQQRVRFDAEDVVDEDHEKDSRTMYKELAKKIVSGERVSLTDDNDDDVDHEDDISDGPSFMNPVDRRMSESFLRDEYFCEIVGAVFQLRRRIQ